MGNSVEVHLPHLPQIHLPHDPAFSLLGIHPKEAKSILPKDIYTSLFSEVLFTTNKKWKNIHGPSTGEWTLKMCHTDMMEYCSPFKKEIILFCGNMDESGGYYTKWNMTGTEWQILHALKKSYRGRIEWWLPGQGGWEKREDTGQRVRSFIYAGWICSEDLTSYMVTIVNKTVLYTWNLLRIDLISSYHIHEKR